MPIIPLFTKLSKFAKGTVFYSTAERIGGRMPPSFYWVSAIFLISFFLTLGVVRAVLRNDKDQLSLALLCVVLAFSCMYLMWVTCYLQQLYPIIRPEKPPHFKQ